MFGRISTTKSTGSCSDNTEKLKKALNEADAVVIGAGAGLSTSAGFVYNGERFEKYFSDFGRKYVLRTCIPADFILMRHRKRCGHTGAGTYGSIAICRSRMTPMTGCMIW